MIAEVFSKRLSYILAAFTLLLSAVLIGGVIFAAREMKLKESKFETMIINSEQPLFVLHEISTGMLSNNAQWNRELTVHFDVFNYHSKTNHPTDLACKNYYMYSHTVSVNKSGSSVRIHSVGSQVITGTPNNGDPCAEADMVELVRKQFNLY